jgi:GNAT superfamily N-acetyltransferase
MRTVAARNVVLEPRLAEHAGEMFVVLGDPAIYEHENEPPASAEWLRARFARLESRRSPDGEQLWLNWVVRLRAAIAYVLASKYWGRGLAAEACQAMIAELAERYGVRTVYAVFKRRNVRSARLLERLGFAPVLPDSAGVDLEPDELLMLRDLDAPE